MIYTETLNQVFVDCSRSSCCQSIGCQRTDEAGMCRKQVVPLSSTATVTHGSNMPLDREALTSAGRRHARSWARPSGLKRLHWAVNHARALEWTLQQACSSFWQTSDGAVGACLETPVLWHVPRSSMEGCLRHQSRSDLRHDARDSKVQGYELSKIRTARHPRFEISSME